LPQQDDVEAVQRLALGLTKGEMIAASSRTVATCTGATSSSPRSESWSGVK